MLASLSSVGPASLEKLWQAQDADFDGWVMGPGFGRDDESWIVGLKTVIPAQAGTHAEASKPESQWPSLY
jgi:hypothetical protein